MKRDDLMKRELTLALVEEAAAFLEGRVRRTPAEYSPILSDVLEQDVYLKLDNLQLTGSFKIRGAFFALYKLKQEGIDQVATCSAGNHGKGIAYAANELGMTARIYVPSGVDRVKYDAMVRLGATVMLSSHMGYDETEQWAKTDAAEAGIPFISAYDDPLVMAGNGGTVALEVQEQVPSAHSFVMPAGGGGHSAGFVFTMRKHDPSCKITLCQHERSPAFKLSEESGSVVTAMEPFVTLASGLEGGFGKNAFQVLKGNVNHVALVSEDELTEAMRWMVDHHQYIIEGSSAVPIAACLKRDIATKKGALVVFISGRNVAMDTFGSVLNGL